MSAGITVIAKRADISNEILSIGTQRNRAPPKYIIIICPIATVVIINIKDLFCDRCENIFAEGVRALNELKIPQKIRSAKNTVRKYVSLLPSKRERIKELFKKKMQRARL